MSMPFFTIKCPICGKGEIPYPFEEKGYGREYCHNCGASREVIETYFNINVKIGFFILKWGLIVFIVMILFDFLKSLF